MASNRLGKRARGAHSGRLEKRYSRVSMSSSLASCLKWHLALYAAHRMALPEAKVTALSSSYPFSRLCRGKGVLGRTRCEENVRERRISSGERVTETNRTSY